jgi:hypothetical protein
VIVHELALTLSADVTSKEAVRLTLAKKSGGLPAVHAHPLPGIVTGVGC